MYVVFFHKGFNIINIHINVVVVVDYTSW